EHRGRFVVTTTGLLVGLILEIFSLTSRTDRFAVVDLNQGAYRTWFLLGSFVVGSVNLVLLIIERKRIDDLETPNQIETAKSTMQARDRAVPGPHFAIGETLRPVRLEPYRPPPYTRSRSRDHSDR